MLTLLSECHFWSLSENVCIKSNDFGAFRYMRQRELHGLEQIEKNAAIAKLDYTERRNGLSVLKSSRKSAGRLKENIKKLEEILRTHKIVYSQWQDAAQVLLLFANGIIAHICVDIYTGDILRMVFEKYLVGKLAAETITDAFFTRSHIVLAYNTNQLTVVYLQKPNKRAQGPEKISNMDPRVFHVIIPGASERKLARHICVNSSFDLFVVWTQSSQNEVYPWRPTIRDQDRANIHLFKLKETQLESFAYCWSENDPLCVDFLRSAESQIITLEQKVSRKGEISAEICSYEINVGKMSRTALTSIVVGAEICCYAFSPDQEKLFLGLIDRNIRLYDLVLQVTKFIGKTEIIPTQCTWHCDSAIIMVANERSQFQCFDLALTPIGNQLQSEDITPLNLLDLSHYFAVQPTLINIAFSRKPVLANFAHIYAQTDCFLLMLYDQGPIGCLRFFAGAGMLGDIHNSGLTADVIVDKYLNLNQLEKAVHLLDALNWETYGAMCLISLHKIANFVFYRSDNRRTHIELMAKALKTFSDNLSEETKDEFSDQIFDLKRRFFFFLIRKNLFTEAFEVAEDIGDYDLFMDLFNLTKCIASLSEFANSAFNQAAVILCEEDRTDGELTATGEYRSESACSQSTCPDTRSKHQLRHNALKNYVPPLPSFKQSSFNADMIKINIPKPEIRLDMQQNRMRVSSTPQPELCQTNLAVSSIGNTLAKLSIKSSSNSITEHKSSTINGNISSKDLPNQTVGLPAITPFVQSLTQSTAPKNFLQQMSANSIQKQTPSTQQSLAIVPKTFPLPSHVLPTYQPKFYQHPLVSGNIPAAAKFSDEFQKRLALKKPSISILSNSSTTSPNGNTTIACENSITTNSAVISFNGNSNKEASNMKGVCGEKNKVKFSDTIQIAVVPDIPRKEKQSSKRNGYARPIPRNLMNPKKELADSLPLCHPNDEYLKDFNPISTSVLEPQTKRKEEEQPPTTTSIKVVHFGVV